jgi:type IV secretory pathway TrbD component
MAHHSLLYPLSAFTIIVGAGYLLAEGIDCSTLGTVVVGWIAAMIGCCLGAAVMGLVAAGQRADERLRRGLSNVFDARDEDERDHVG